MKLSEGPMFEMLSGDLGENSDAWSKAIYKGTECGAWLKIISDKKILVGSIVEGADVCCDTHELEWPFTMKELYGALDAIEEQADEIWNEWNVE